MLEVDAVSPDAARARFADRRVVLMAETKCGGGGVHGSRSARRYGEGSVVVLQR